MEGHHGRIGGGDHLTSGEALQQGRQAQGLQGGDARGDGHPEAIRFKRPAQGIEGSDGGLIAGRHQSEGFGGGEQPTQAQAITQPITVGVDQGHGRRGILQPPSLAQAVAIESGAVGGLQPATLAQLSGLLIGEDRGVDHGLIFGS